MTLETDIPVPAEFPVAESFVALSGIQPKLGLIERDGHFFSSLASRQEQYRACERVATDLARALASDSGSWEDQIVNSLKSLRKQGRFSESQNLWVIRRVAALLSFRLPPLPSPSDEYTMEITDAYLAELRGKQNLTQLERAILEADQEYRLKLSQRALGRI